MTVEIPLADVRRACELLIAHVERHGGSVTVEHDYFWSVPLESAYDVDAEPADLTIGQVTESWEHVRTMLDDESRTVGYGLVWLADVLRAVGHGTTG
ncbi:MAG: hypothetical protein ABIQ18_26665 [Umezawaea sp.]